MSRLLWVHDCYAGSVTYKEKHFLLKTQSPLKQRAKLQFRG